MKYYVAFIRDRSGSSFETYGKLFQAKSMAYARSYAVMEFDRPQDKIWCRPGEVRLAEQKDLDYYLPGATI